MKKAIVFLANGFEEMEATGTVDIFASRRYRHEKQSPSQTTVKWWVPIIWNIWQMPYFPKLIFQV